MASITSKFDPIVSIVGFHHARGPEVEHWIGVEDPTTLSEWPLLPFMALSDGAHSLDSSSEDFSYFTLKHILKQTDGTIDRPISLFGISCTRQLDSSTLIKRSSEVTRSTVQKAVVVIADSPVYFGGLKEKLGMVTRAWFAQRDFDDLDIIRKFQDSLKVSLSIGSDQYLGLSLRELVFEFRQQTLVLFKCCLLQPKMLFFGSRCDRLCMTQFSLLSLIPGLLGALEDSADPDLNYYEGRLFKPTSVRTSDRKSLLTFMGMPLQIFGKGSLFGPYTPLQQLDILADVGTKSYIVGSTNSLLLQQKDRYSDILINLDEHTVNITSSSLRTALQLTSADRRWIDSVVQAVAESWDENDPSRPNTMGFVGSEDYIRLQFEEYILSMVSSVKCHDFLQKHAGTASRMLPDVDGDPALDFGMDFIDMWKKTENYRIFQKFTDSELFDLVPPKHVMAGGLTMDDVSRRISQQLNDLKLDEKMVNGREAVAKTLVAGRGKLGAAFSTLTSNVASLREAQAKKLSNPEPKSPAPSITPSVDSTETAEKPSEQAPPAKGGYFSAWASWAGEKKRKAFGGTPAQTPGSSPPMKATASSETTSAAPSIIGSPKVPVTNSRGASHAEDIYDAETGIGKGDSGFISPPYRASLDMHPQAQARRNTQESNVESEPAKGLFSVIAEQFQMVDIRKSLPPPPPPEKEPLPEIPVKSEEDREFLRNLRKSLPPPPSEIDFLPDMLSTPGPPPGPLVAQEATIIESMPSPESVIPHEKPLAKDIPQNAAKDKVETESKTQAEGRFESGTGSDTSAQGERTGNSRLHRQSTSLSQKLQEQRTTVAPESTPKEPRVARLKARNLINQYVRQEKDNETHDDPAIEKNQGQENNGRGVLTEATRKTERSVEAGVQSKDASEHRSSLRRESMAAGYNARNSLRKSFAQDTDAQAWISGAGGEKNNYNSQPELPPASSDNAEIRTKYSEQTTDLPVVAEPAPRNPRFKARGLIRKFVAQEQEAQIQQSQSDQATEESNPVFSEEPKQVPIQRTRTRTLSQGECLRYSPTIPQTNRQSLVSEPPPEQPPATPSRFQKSPVPLQHVDTGSAISGANDESILPPVDSTAKERRYSRSKDINTADHPPIFKRKSIPAFPGSPIVESESPTREVGTVPLRISKRRSTMKSVENVVAPESPEVTIQMKRKSLRSIGGDYASLESAFKDKETKEKEREKEREEREKEREKEREIERAMAREKERERERKERKRLEKEQREKEQEKEQQKREQLESERLEKEQKDREQQERERLEREQQEKERQEKQRQEEEREAKEQQEKERQEKERQEKERQEKERQEKERQEEERQEKERQEKERQEKERQEKERQEKERQEKDRQEKERLEKERLEREQREMEKLQLERERMEREQREREQREKEQREKEREKEQREKEQREKEQREKEQREKEQREKEQREKERLEAEQREMEQEIERAKEQRRREKESAKPEPSPSSPPPPLLIKRKTIPAVFAQADAELEQKPKLSRATTGVGSLPRTPSPGLTSASNTSSTASTPSERKIGGRNRSGTLAQGPPGILGLNKATSPSMPALPSVKELPKHGIRTPSPTKDTHPTPTEKPRIPSSITTKGIRPPTNDADTAPLSPGRAAVAESRAGPGRIGGGLKDNPFLKNDLASPTSGSDGVPARKRVGTLKNNPFIKNDVKSPTSPPPAR